MPGLLGPIVREAGKTLPNAIGEVREAVDFLRYYAARLRRDGFGESDTHRPLGPVACISPWNFPLAIFTGQVAAALAAGNPVLAKPAEETPLVAALAVRLLRERGLHPPLLFAGAGKPLHRRPVEKLVEELGLQGQVRFLGLHREVPALLMRHRIGVLSTHYEGMPMALIEAMAAGCAVVGTAVAVASTIATGNVSHVLQVYVVALPRSPCLTHKHEHAGLV